MFGLFSSRQKKIEQKLFSLANEISGIQKNIILYPKENTYKDLHIDKTKELNNLYNDLEKIKNKDYVKNFIGQLTIKYKASENVLSKEEQKLLDKLLIEHKVKAKIKI